MRDYTVMIEAEDGTELECRNFDSIEEARKFCDDFDWLWEDKDGHHWEMYIRDNRYDRMFA